MLFNSLSFAVFVPVIFSIYWALHRHHLNYQNVVILIASYVFYGWWDWRFLALIFLSSIVDFFVGLQLEKASSLSFRKMLLAISLLVNLGLLGYFKYCGFFIESFVNLLHQLDMQANNLALQIILPVGISFYTFQTLSYTIDVYRRRMHATKNPIAFFAFVSFFPQLVAGPIERAQSLLPQFERKRTFDINKANDGLRQILWGLFKKVVIADNLASHVDFVFGNYLELSGIALGLGTLYFAIQIYCDFSGYSDIAIGVAKLFGFRLMRNFAYPYFSRNIAEFWRRWHISLSTWFRDYVFILLGGNRVTRTRHIWNVMLTFAISGLWHGSNWNFVVWGALHGFYYVIFLLVKGKKSSTQSMSVAKSDNPALPSLRELSQIGITFSMTLFAWIFFRADSVEHALQFVGHMVTHSWLDNPGSTQPLLFIGILLTIDWIQARKHHALQIGWMPAWARWAAYSTLIAIMFVYWGDKHVPFIYFQF